MNSGSVLAGRSFGTMMTRGDSTASPSGVKSFIVS